MKIHHVDDYAELRREAYPGESEQVHALVKIVQALLEQTPVPDDAAAILAKVNEVKQMYPKESA